MTGKTKKKKRRMESDGTVGEKTANTHRERLTCAEGRIKEEQHVE